MNSRVLSPQMSTKTAHHMITTTALTKRAAKGDFGSQFRLGYRLAFGASTKAEPDWQRIVEYWRPAAEAGHIRAQFYLGTCFDLGHGVSRNVARAMLWYKKAAVKGHRDAQYNIAFSYLRGRGLPRNPELAVKWYRRAALQNHIESQRELGYCYHEGLGLRRDFRAAGTVVS